MTPEKIIKFCKVLSITDLDILIEELQYIRNEKYNYTYKEVLIYPPNKIVEQIKEETGFYCYHVPCENNYSGRGTHVIVIPKEKYSKKLEKELQIKYHYEG